MMKIKTWIFLPLLMILLTLPVGIQLIFNVTSNDYVEQMAERDLKKTLSIVQPIAEEIFSRDEAADIGSVEQTAQAREFFIRVQQEFTKQKTGAQLIVTGRDNEMTYPEYGTAVADTKNVYKYFIDRLINNPEEVMLDEITTAVIDEKMYMVYIMRIEVVKRNRYLIAYSELRDVSELLAATGRLVLLITCTLAALVTFIAWFLSKRISKPIEKFCTHARLLNRGNIPLISEKSRILEIATLSNELNEMSMRLRQYEEDQRTFYQNVAHELRTPLMSIRGYAEGIEYGAFPDNKDAARVIVSQSMRLSDMAGELLLLSEIENAGIKADIQTFDIVEFLREQIRLLAGVAFTGNVEMRLEESDRIMVDADGELLAKAVSNVLANCVRYAKSEVVVRLEKEEALKIYISDDGGGIQPETLEHIFKRFYKGRGGNTGLGLAISKAALECMNGSISAYNAELGAVFLLTVPLSKADKVSR